MIDAIILTLIALLAIFIISVILVKKGILGDRDKDGVADVIEDTVDKAKAKVKDLKKKK